VLEVQVEEIICNAYPTLMTSPKFRDSAKKSGFQHKELFKYSSAIIQDDIAAIGDDGIEHFDAMIAADQAKGLAAENIGRNDHSSASKYPVSALSPTCSSTTITTTTTATTATTLTHTLAPTPPAMETLCGRQAQVMPTPRKQGVLGRCVELMQKAVTMDSEGNVIAADRELLIQSFEAYAGVLDKLGNIGSHVSGNTKKLRNSKAVASKSDYKEWLISELPVHASNKYKDYADPSAGVASVWIGWTLEFFVEMFANLYGGQETGPSINDAYKNTLSAHHNFIMRNAFSLGVRQQMPSRKKLYELLRGEAEPDDVVREIEQFVHVCRAIVKYLLQLHEVMFKLFEAERKSLKRK
jgi:hypothetical protein